MVVLTHRNDALTFVKPFGDTWERKDPSIEKDVQVENLSRGFLESPIGVCD